MATIDLKYGNGSLPLEYDADRFAVLGQSGRVNGLSDVEINAKLDDPFGTQPVEEIVAEGETVLIVVPDATREVGCGQIVNLLVRRLIANGTLPGNIRIIFATGIHRPVTEIEKAFILTPFVAQRIKTLEHSPRDLAGFVRVGETRAGIPIELNRALVEHDRVIIIGGVSFHYFAGFTGGRKLICPGLASNKTITQTHSLAFDCVNMTRRPGVGTAMLDGNAVNEAFEEAASLVEPCFAITSVVNDGGEIVDLFCGHWRDSHRAACDAFDQTNTLAVSERRPFVIASCGGYPHDINLIQGHKALEAASKACLPGGNITLIAECADGLGRDDFLRWFETGSSQMIAQRLCEKYQVNGQTAWNFRRLAEEFRVTIMSSIEPSVITQLGAEPYRSMDHALALGTSENGYILPDGAKIRVQVQPLLG